MIFEDFKKDLISIYRRYDFDQYFHFIIKSENWDDVTQILLKEPIKHIDYGFKKGIITLDLLREIPEEVREKHYVFDREINIDNYNKNIVLLGGGKLVINQSSNSRCKIVCLGNSNVS